MKDGRLLFIYTQFFGGDSDPSSAKIVSIQSTNEGRTWDATAKTSSRTRAEPIHWVKDAVPLAYCIVTARSAD